MLKDLCLLCLLIGKCSHKMCRSCVTKTVWSEAEIKGTHLRRNAICPWCRVRTFDIKQQILDDDYIGLLQRLELLGVMKRPEDDAIHAHEDGNKCSALRPFANEDSSLQQVAEMIRGEKLTKTKLKMGKILLKASKIDCTGSTGVFKPALENLGENLLRDVYRLPDEEIAWNKFASDLFFVYDSFILRYVVFLFSPVHSMQFPMRWPGSQMKFSTLT